jgi:polar amino acid transport system substrate-binding protein
LYEGGADLSIFSKEWMKHPEKLIYSEPIYVQREFLYANTPIKHAPLEDTIKHKTICTRRGYFYPELEPFFKAQKASRMDSDYELSQLKMLRRKRCDFVIADEFVGGFLIDRNGWKNEVHPSEQAISSVNFTIAFHPNMQGIVEVVDAHIRGIKSSGLLAQIIQTQRSAAATVKQATKQ